MDGERTFHSFLDDFDDRARELMGAPVASLLSSFDPRSADATRDALQALRATGADCPELSFTVALCDLACDHERSPERTAAASDLLARAIRDVRELRSSEDFALFFAYATARCYDVLALAFERHEQAMRTVIERIERLDGLQDALGIAGPALQQVAHTIGVSDEDNEALLAASCRTCDEACACGAAIAMALAENLDRPSSLTEAALDEWYNLPRDIEAAAASVDVSWGEESLSALVRPQTGLTERVRRTIEQNAARER